MYKKNKTQVKKMNVKSLSQMEKIVKNNRNLSWDGWDVVQTNQNPMAWKSPSGIFIKGKWYTKIVYRVSESGWNIPDKLVR
jgi:hypothetical protein